VVRKKFQRVIFSLGVYNFLWPFLGLFDSILRNPTVAIDWAILLTQLVTSGVVDSSNNTELFATLQDMLATLLHSTLVTDGQSDRGEDSRKYHPILIKKLKKELVERKGSSSIQCIKQLLPLPKLASEFVTCEPYGTLTDTKVWLSNNNCINFQMFVESIYYHDCNAFRATRLVDLTVMIRSKDTDCMKSNEFLRGKYWKDTKQLPHFLGLGLELFVLRGNLSGTKKSSGCYVTIHMRCKNLHHTIWNTQPFHQRNWNLL
jgi:hypothetical protein